MISSANDSNLIAWGPGGGVVDKVKVSICLHLYSDCRANKINRYKKMEQLYI